MVRLMNTPEVELAERLAITALRSGWATYDNCYRVLADCHGVLAISAHKMQDATLSAVTKLGYTAMVNIFERMQRVGKVGASSDELSALITMLDFSDDYWRRQSAAHLEQCVLALREVRRKQKAERLKEAA